MIDLAKLDFRARTWLKRVPLSAIVILLKAIHEELESRAATRRVDRRIGQDARILHG